MSQNLSLTAVVIGALSVKAHYCIKPISHTIGPTKGTKLMWLFFSHLFKHVFWVLKRTVPTKQQIFSLKIEKINFLLNTLTCIWWHIWPGRIKPMLIITRLSEVQQFETWWDPLNLTPADLFIPLIHHILEFSWGFYFQETSREVLWK